MFDWFKATSFVIGVYFVCFGNMEAMGKGVACISRQELTARSPGIVVKYYVENGQKVKPGQPLVEFDSRLLRAGVKETQGAIDAAKASVDLASDALHRLQKIGPGEGVTEQQVVEASFKVAQAKAIHRQAEGALDRLKVQLDDTLIKAVLPGEIGGVPSIIGFPVVAGQSLGYIQADVSKCQSAGLQNN